MCGCRYDVVLKMCNKCCFTNLHNIMNIYENKKISNGSIPTVYFLHSKSFSNWIFSSVIFVILSWTSLVVSLNLDSMSYEQEGMALLTVEKQRFGMSSVWTISCVGTQPSHLQVACLLTLLINFLIDWSTQITWKNPLQLQHCMNLPGLYPKHKMHIRPVSAILTKNTWNDQNR